MACLLVIFRQPTWASTKNGFHLFLADECVTRQIPQLLSIGGSFLHLDLQRLSRVKDELLEVSLIDMLLELFLEELTVNYVMTHSVMECTVVSCFGAL